jgi:RNA polymerase sigma-70 factor (ECF subfamily)
MKWRGPPTLKNLSGEAEAALIGQAQAGDREAFGELMRSHYPSLVRVAYRICGDPNLAEDAAQEAFIRAWQRLDAYRPLSPLRNWLYRIAVNVTLDMLRRQRGTDKELESLPIHDPQPGPEASLVKKERAALVQGAILSLTPAGRVVLVLREYGELSYQEIAEALDIPLGTVMSRLNYARKSLREYLETQLSPVEVEDG